MNTRKFLSMLAIASLFMSSCSDDDENPEPVSPEEVITTMTVTLTDGSDPVTLSFFDADGEDGPAEPESNVSGSLKANTTYGGSIVLLNATEDPAEVVNEEIEEEADEHQFFYIPEGLGITTGYSDNESDYVNSDGEPFESTNPVGIRFTLTTSDAIGDGSLRVVLRHEPVKDAEGVVDGDITNAGGSPDIDWTFNISVVE